jgi:ClpP class serine protease
MMRKANLQSRVNDAGADFIKAVASGRKVTQAKVKDEFGQGRMFGARDALARGMADRIAHARPGHLRHGRQDADARASRRRSALAFE